MSMGSGIGAAAAAEEMINFIQGTPQPFTSGTLESYLGRALTDADKEILQPILGRLQEIKRAGESGWY